MITFIGNYRILSEAGKSRLSTIYIAESTSTSTAPVLIAYWHGIHITGEEDTQTLQLKARHGVIPTDTQSISLLDAQVYQQSPYIVIAYTQEAVTPLTIHAQRIEQEIDRQEALYPGNPRTPIGVFLALFCLPDTSISFTGSTIPNASNTSATFSSTDPNLSNSGFNADNTIPNSNPGSTNPNIAGSTLHSDNTIPNPNSGNISPNFPNPTIPDPNSGNISPNYSNPTIPNPNSGNISPNSGPDFSNTNPDFSSWPQFNNSKVIRSKTDRNAEFKQWLQKPAGKRSIRIASIVLLLIVLIGGGVLLNIFLPASAATVTITPQSKRITHTYDISLTSNNPGTYQAKEHVITYVTPARSQTVSATGKGHHAATQAQGKVVISQIDIKTGEKSFEVASSEIDANDGTTVTLDSFIAVDGGSVSVSAHANTAGAAGNIPAGDISMPCEIYNQQTLAQDATAYCENTSDFSGGRDAFDYTYVQQKDIDGATKTLSSQLTSGAQQQAKKQIRTGEQLVQDITCKNIVNSNHKAQDAADSVKVTVKVECDGVAYKAQDIQAAAVNAQKVDAAAQLGASYQLAGNVITSKPTLNQSTATAGAAATYQVSTDSIWVFQVDKAQQQQIAQAIAGHSQQSAMQQLQQRTGIKNAKIATTGSFIGTALPQAPGSIKFTIIPVAGLTSGTV